MSNSFGEKKKKKGFAKIEFLAVQPEAISLLQAGHTFRSAYEVLKSAGKITMSYPRFVWFSRNGVKSRLDSPPISKKANNTDAEAPPSPLPAHKNGTSNLPTPAEERVLGVVETNAFKQKISKEEKEKLI